MPRLAKIMDGDDVRMTDCRGGAGLTPETLRRAFVEDEVLMEDLDRHYIADVQAPGAVDGPHPALAQPLDELVLGIEHETHQRVGGKPFFFVSRDAWTYLVS